MNEKTGKIKVKKKKMVFTIFQKGLHGVEEGRGWKGESRERVGGGQGEGRGRVGVGEWKS